MKKNYFLVALLIFLVTAITGKAQSYSLKDLTPDQFSSGGTDMWSFERHDVNAGVYAPFTTYGNNSNAVNYYDTYITERFGFYPIMNRPASGGQYDVKRNAWFSDANEFAYVAAEYPTGTKVGDNLVYGEASYPDSLTGYEVYSNSLTAVNSAITFTAPANGYYRADMRLLRMDPSASIGEMTASQYFRYGGTGTAYPLGQEFFYGKSRGIDCAAAANAAIYNEYLAKIPEYPTVNNNWSQPFRWLPGYSTSRYFYFFAKTGDKISFETDARSTGNTETKPRGAYARTKWINLAVTVSDAATATADVSKLVDPYKQDQSLIDSLNTVLVEAEAVINDSKYSQFSRDALSALYTNIDQRLTAGAVATMEIPSLIDQLHNAIAACRATVPGLKARYTFDNVTNGVVPDLSGQGNNGTLVNNASIVKQGKYNVMDLGLDKGYMDMGSTIGSVAASMSDYTFSAYYRIDPSVTLSGNGYDLFAFSTMPACSASAGQYLYYRTTSQSLAISPAGWNKSKGISVGTAATKGAWQHVVVQQKDTLCTIYVNGVVVKSGIAPKPSSVFTASTSSNWIGRPCFGGDSYLKNTFVYDVRLYNYAVTVDSITKWNGVVADLEIESNKGTGGEDYHVLDSLATAYTSLVGTYTIGVAAGTYPQSGKDAIMAAIASAQALSSAHASSQLKINSEVSSLKAAYQTFLASMIVETNTLLEGKYYITLTDSLYLTNPGTALLANGSYLTIANGGLSKTKITADSSQVFTLAKVTSLDPARFSIFSALNEGGTYRHLTEMPVVQSNWGTPGGGTNSGDDNWRTVNIVYNGTAYAIQDAGKSASRGYWQYDLANKKLVSGSSQAAYQFKFISLATGVNDVVNSGIRIFAAKNAIRVTTDEPAMANVYNVAGILIHKVAITGTQSINVPSGIYIVKVVGRTSVVSKVIVN